MSRTIDPAEMDAAIAQMRRLQQDVQPGSSKFLILDAAEESFSEYGYEGASISKIAERAGLSKTGMLHHFPSKQALLDGVLARRDLREAEQIGMGDTASVAALMRAQVDLARATANNKALLKFAIVMAIEGSAVDHPAHRWAVERYAWTRSLFAAAFQRDIDAGRVRSTVDPVAAASQLIAMLDGLEVQWLLAPDEVDRTDLIEQYVEQWIAVNTVEDDRA